jgi:ABC-2 type transport system permease protein/oleandomycin transport system permease protein
VTSAASAAAPSPSTALAATTDADLDARLPRSAVVTDTMVIARRNLLRIARTPQLLVFSTIQPVMFVLLFVYVFGGTIRIPGLRYVDYLIPGILVQTVVFGGASTSVGLADDLSKGLIDRFRSLPMARSAVLAGRTVADTGRNLFVVVLMLVVGTLVGFRFHNGFVPALAAIGLALLFGYAFSWVFALVGLSVRDPEAAQLAGFLPIFPLVFASSVFTPVRNMPGWLQGFAKAQPITVTVNAIRSLSQGGPVARPLVQSLAWIAGLLAVFVPLAVARYRRG